MLSYREKQLFAVQKYLLDESAAFSEQLCKATDSFSGKQSFDYTLPEKPEMENYDSLVEYVQEQGYDLYIRAEDLLSPQELEQLDAEYKTVNDEFKKLTGLHKADIAFLAGATALQVARIIIQAQFEKEAFVDRKDRPNDKQAEKEVKTKENKEKLKDRGEQASGDATKKSRYYYAPLSDIANLAKGVPYDTIKGSKKFGINLSGNNHRSKTLGHDPYLGYLFGTCNIMTNTISVKMPTKLPIKGLELFGCRTFHVKGNEITENAQMVLMFRHSAQRFKESKKTVLAALLKQFLHIKSDTLSKKGISIPGLQMFLDSDQIEAITEHFDYAMLKKVGHQAEFAAMVNFVVWAAHKLYLFSEDRDLKPETAEESLHAHLIDADDVKTIRTKKVILYSNLIASSSDIIACAAAAAAGVIGENPALVDTAKKYLDVGGILVTLTELFRDVRFFTKVKKEFIQKALDEDFDKKLIELQEQTDMILLDETAEATRTRLQA